MSTVSGPLRLGIDAVDVPRFRSLLSRRPRTKVRLFTDKELGFAAGRRDPAPRLAARFAAKEAAMKALGVGIGAFKFHDVEVERLPSGKPRLVLQGGAARLATAQGIEQWELSLTHTDTVAEAVVIGVRG